MVEPHTVDCKAKTKASFEKYQLVVLLLDHGLSHTRDLLVATTLAFIKASIKVPRGYCF